MDMQSIQAAELTQAMDDFYEWFAREKDNGLVDVKFFLGNTSSNNATIERAVLEFNHSNRMIGADITEPHLDAIND